MLLSNGDAVSCCSSDGNCSAGELERIEDHLCPFNRNALSTEALLFAQFAHFAVLLLQVISLFAFAFGVNVCMGFTTNRFRRSEEWDEGPVSGTVTNVNCTSQYPYVIYCG